VRSRPADTARWMEHTRLPHRWHPSTRTPSTLLRRWTGSSALETDCEGNRVTATTKLSSECIAKKKVAEIKARQAINEQNGQYKVKKLEKMEKRAAAEAAERAERDAEVKARQAKYALKR